MLFGSLLNAWNHTRTQLILRIFEYLFYRIFACRYNDIKQDIAEELAGLREEGATLENVSHIRFLTVNQKILVTVVEISILQQTYIS